MRFIRFSMRNKKDDFTLAMPKAEQVLKATQQTVMVANEDGTWSGIFVNKADISKTDRDYEAEKDWHRNNPTPALEEPVQNPASPEYVEKVGQEIREMLKGKRV